MAKEPAGHGRCRIGSNCINRRSNARNRMKFSDVIKEDWGTSDWTPLMNSIKKAVAGGTTLRDAARDEASRYYKDLGYDNEEDATDRIVYMFKLRNKDNQKVAEAKYETKGSWKIQNMGGILKNFKDAESPEARAWMKNRTGDEGSKWNKERGAWEGSARERKEDREQGQRQRQRDADREDHKPKKTSAAGLDKLYQKAEDYIGQSFPDGDPMDYIAPYMRTNGYQTGDLDLAYKKNVKMDFYKYLATTWKEHAADRVYDAREQLKQGKEPSDGHPFFTIKDGKVIALENPWA